MQLQEKNTLQGSSQAWVVVGTDIVMLNSENLLCIMDYYS